MLFVLNPIPPTPEPIFYKQLVRVEGQVSQSMPELAKTHDVPIDTRVTKLVKGNDIWIEVDLAEQMLYVYEGSEIKSAYRVSTGRPGTPTRKSMATRKGVYRIYYMKESYPMWGRSDGGWWYPDVPYAMFFHHEYAIHGAPWHNNFGTPVSHGCVNLTEMDAKSVYELVEKRSVVWVH